MKSRPFSMFLLIMMIISLTACMKGSENPTDGYSANTEAATTSEVDFTNLSVEEITPVSFSSGRASIQIADRTTSYLLILNAANTLPGNYGLQLADESAPLLQLPHLEVEKGLEDPDSALFHQFLNESGAEMAQSPEFQQLGSRSSFSALTKTMAVGDKQTFKVLSSMTSLSRYEQVEATLRVVTDDLLFFVEDDSADHISDEEIQDLANKFQNTILPTDRSLFGNESDINGDSHISIVMTCVTNRMASSGIVTGFFFPGDLYASSSVNPASNEQEIFYTLLPDPNGRCGIPISSDFALTNILPGVLAHEYQHMISFNRHVFLGNGKTEEPWLNEALSHLAEDLNGFGLENYSRVKLFLSRPNATPLISAASPTLAERGAGYAFLRYLYEQSGNGQQFLQNLLEGKATGVSNIVSSFASGDSSFDEFPEFLNNWSIALALTDTNMTTDPRFNYEPRGTDATSGNPTGLCLRCTANDGRGTILNGPSIVEVESYPLTSNLNATAAQFFLIQDAPTDLWIQSTGSPTLTGSILRLE
ncbi:MAG: hypothetical protein HYT76_04620 [Deltaproteobacteria bacterium]|nr:hypothetical protein [Deltaproteobacteria bacterium]